jgi:hypothetical protein
VNAVPEWRRDDGPPVVVVDRRGRAAWDDLRGKIPDPAAVWRSDDAWVLAAHVRLSIDDGCRYVVCVGGDEAWLAAAHGAAASDDAAVLVGHGGGPASLPRVFGLGDDPVRCASRLMSGTSQPLDTIVVRPTDGPVVTAANMVWWGAGRRLGWWYRITGDASLAWRAGATSLRHGLVDIRMGDVEREYTSCAIAIANGEYLGALDVAPRAHPGDGKLEVLVFEGWATDFWRMTPRLRGGAHLPHPRVRELRPSSMRIDGRGRLFADGRDVGRLPADVAVRPGHLRIAL